MRCLLDEFANLGKIPNFERLIATIRSREISACVILQTQSQLKTMYKALEHRGCTERVDHRSYERQGVDKIPAVHLGVAAHQMELKGVRTNRGDMNREINLTNKHLRQLRARIVKLQDWLKENSAQPNLADVLQGILAQSDWHYATSLA